MATAVAALSGIAMIATAGRAGTGAIAAARSGSDSEPSADKIATKAAGFRRLFCFRFQRVMAGDIQSVCWTSEVRFAKRRPLAKAFRAGFRAHSSVGRADDS